MVAHYIKNWGRLTNSKFELNDVDGKFIKGIFTSIKNPNSLILALNEIFNEKDPELKISKAKHLFKELEIFNKCSAEKERYMKLAIDALTAIESPTKKDLFFEISDFLLNRDA